MKENFSPVFIGHGSPLNALASNSYTSFLQQYAKSISVPEAIIVISAHWQTKGTFITGNKNPGQIYDFYGFPDELYQVRYSPKGSETIAKYLEDENSGIKTDYKRGIDHAGWAVVKHMYPDQNVPLLELSLDLNKTEREHYNLGKALAKYSNQGILFIGSGNVIHNLSDISFDENEKPYPWAVDGDHWIKEQIETKNIDSLLNYKITFPHYRKSIPTNEHYLPLLYILGMMNEKSKVNTIYEEIQNGSISMRSIEII